VENKGMYWTKACMEYIADKRKRGEVTGGIEKIT
jgi:hypothetical protein